MKRVLVTGATGRLGKRVVQDLIAADYEVVAVSENAERLQSLQSLSSTGRLRLIPCDLADADQTSRLAQLVNDINVLVHLAGRQPADPSDHSACTRQVIMSLNIIENMGPLIVHAVLGSCVSVYGDTPGVPVSTTYPNTYHGVSQLAIEKFWNLFAANTDKLVTCLRFASFAPTEKGIGDATQNPSHGETPGRCDVYAEASRQTLLAVSAGKGGLLNVDPVSKDCCPPET